MSGAPSSSTEPVTHIHQLIAYIEQGARPKHEWRIGTEHEKFVHRLEDFGPVDYAGERGIGEFLIRMQRFGWEPVHEAGNVIALKRAGGASISLEPGGQIELSGAQLESLHDTCSEVGNHLEQVNEVSRELQVGMLGFGFHPHWRREQIPWMPKQRYDVMGRYMPQVGSMGLDMMLRTCTVQVNLDFSSESDMVRKMRVGMALQPIATALFANSPLCEGKPNGYLSYRSRVWEDTDPDRCGILPFVFESGMGIERYVEYVLDVPMYFVHRDGFYVDCAGESFRDFLAGRLPQLPGEYPTLGDWDLHLSTLFPEVRLKQFLEMRGADGGGWQGLCALPALWTGLLYDSAALSAAEELISDWSGEEVMQLRHEVPRTALRTQFRNTTVREIARDVLAIADEGLANRNRLDKRGRDERRHIERLWQTVDSGVTPAEELLDVFHNRWRGDIEPVYTEFAY
ncbi:glutamate--cysteine ligase [Halorhodospira halochloris]|uniref:Glutamate--cysteine ligase n=1 Tax=Halorhodospira halochloris TaxID=1052 RepID=A0A0X8XCA9_HALHR|nr:glutamate--cysteine ligase [Halorhodospira halochloris]MBK1652525.1 glutamate--cysteine ligase [Halorhodospira halochloris]BAU57849.1 glutamate--cysteine ligase [Halorhodospira halochloris]